MRFAHYLDSVRQSVAGGLGNLGAGALAFIAQLNGQALSAEEQASANTYAAAYPSEALTLSMAQGPMGSQPSAAFPTLTYQQAAHRIGLRAAHGPHAISQLSIDVSSQLLRRGINPGGYSQDVLWTDPANRSGHWSALFNWPAGGIPSAKPNGQLTNDQQAHLARIRDEALVELMDTVFSGQRSLESLYIAFATTDRLSFPAPDQNVQEAAWRYPSPWFA